jgi:integrase/recombinase XerD
MTIQAYTPLDQARIVGRAETYLLSADLPPTATLNEEAVLAYLTWMRDTRGCTEGTITNYAGVLSHYLDECVGDRPLDMVPVEDVEAWLLRPRSGRARGNVASPATRQRNIAVLSSCYKFLTARGFTTRNIADLLTSPKVNNRQPKPIRDEVWVSHYPRFDTDARIAMGLMFFFGLRREEACNLTGDMIDSSQGIIRDFLRKGGGDDSYPYRDVLTVYADKLPHLLCGRSVDGIATDIERRARERGSGPLLGWSPDGMNKRFQNETWAAGKFTPHQLRHSAATNLLRAGVPLDMVAWLMNHASPTTTMRYLKQSGARLREWMGT